MVEIICCENLFVFFGGFVLFLSEVGKSGGWGDSRKEDWFGR